MKDREGEKNRLTVDLPFICRLGIHWHPSVSEGRMLPWKILQHSGPELVFESFETESSSKQQFLTDEVIQKLTVSELWIVTTVCPQVVFVQILTLFIARHPSLSALQSTYHEAITQQDPSFICCELPTKVPAPDSCQLSIQLLVGSQLLNSNTP